jgi:hypothetical protein
VGAGEAVNAEIGDLLISVCPSWSFALAALVRECVEEQEQELRDSLQRLLT